MKKLKIYLLTLSLAALFFACEEEVNPNLDIASPQVVIEGIFTDMNQPHYVYISETSDYYTPGVKIDGTGATVTLSDNQGNSEVLEEVAPGKYESDELIGVTGNVYTLAINYKGVDYRASGEMQVPPVFDSLTYRFVEETPLKDEGYYLYFYGKTPKPEINYYRWLVYKNDTLYNTEPEDFLIASDEFVTEQLSDLEFPFAFEVGDTLRLEMYGLDYEMYLYYNELLNILFNDGGLFSSQPVNPTNNIENLTEPANKPLGYFQVSAYADEEVIIKEE